MWRAVKASSANVHRAMSGVTAMPWGRRGAPWCRRSSSVGELLFVVVLVVVLVIVVRGDNRKEAAMAMAMSMAAALADEGTTGETHPLVRLGSE